MQIAFKESLLLRGSESFVVPSGIENVKMDRTTGFLVVFDGCVTLSHIKEKVQAQGIQVQEDNDDIWRSEIK